MRKQPCSNPASYNSLFYFVVCLMLSLVFSNTQAAPQTTSPGVKRVIVPKTVIPKSRVRISIPVLSKPNASDNAYTDKTRITWSGVKGISQYKVFRCTSTRTSSCGAGVNRTTTSYNDTSVIAGRRYYYRVQACVATSKCGSYSGYNAGSRRLSAPTGITAVDNSYSFDTIGVLWSPVTGASSYRLFRCTGTGTGTCGNRVTVTSNSHDDSGLAPGSAYYYRVQACSNAGCSSLSNANAGSTRVLQAPTNVAASQTLRSDRPVVVSWNSVAGATTFQVFRCQYSSLQSCGQGINDSSSPYDDMGGAEGIPYQYRVKACISTGCGDFSESDSGLRSAIPPSPSSVTASYNTYPDKIRVIWSNVNVATRYIVYRCSGGPPYFVPCESVTESGVSPFDDTGGDPTMAYRYRVVACTATRCSQQGGFSSVGQRLQLPPRPSFKPYASSGTYTDKVSIGWGITGPDSFKVFRCTETSTVACGSGFSVNAPTNTYDDTGGVAGTEYYYRIQSCNAAGCSAHSDYDKGHRRE